MRQLSILLTSTLFLVGCSGDVESGGANTLEEDLAYFSTLLDGEFTDKLIAGEDAAPRLYVYRKVDLPAFGDHVVYVQQYYGAGDGDPDASVYRQRIYATVTDAERNELVTRIYSFPEGRDADFVDAQFDPSLLADLTPEMMGTLPDGCEVFWKREGDDILGYQREGDCIMNVPNTDMKMMLSDDLKLASGSFTTLTKGKDMDGNMLFGEEVPLEMVKANIYSCKMSAGGKETGFRIHDQGGIAVVPGDNGRKLVLSRIVPRDPDSSATLQALSSTGERLASAEGKDGSISLDIGGGEKVGCSRAANTWEKPSA